MCLKSRKTILNHIPPANPTQVEKFSTDFYSISHKMFASISSSNLAKHISTFLYYLYVTKKTCTLRSIHPKPNETNYMHISISNFLLMYYTITDCRGLVVEEMANNNNICSLANVTGGLACFKMMNTDFSKKKSS